MNRLKPILAAAAVLLILTASGCGQKDKDRISDGGYEISKPSSTESSHSSVKKPIKSSNSSETSGSSETTNSGSSRLEITVPDAWYDGSSFPDKKDDSPSNSSKTDSKPQKNESILSSLPSGFVKKK